jgi:hypothetical protein
MAMLFVSLVLVGVSSMGSQPRYKQWLSNHREWWLVNPLQMGPWWMSHTLGLCNP